MNRSHTWIALALAIVATPAAGEALTWQEANKRSAALIREKGPSAEAADLARQAFDLYREQTKSYSATNHAQLLLNAASARRDAEGGAKALKEIERGAAVIGRVAGPDTDVLIAIWEEGATMAGRGTPPAAKYSTLALQQAEKVLGPDHPRTIALLLDVIHDKRSSESNAWVIARYSDARARAAKAGPDSRQVTEIDLQLAKLALESGRSAQAIDAYRAVIERLEERQQRDQETYLQLAYAQIEYAYEQQGKMEAAAQWRARRAQRLLGDSGELMPTLRVSPQYPRAAARGGVEGVVLLLVDVNPDGTVADLRVLESEPSGIFDEAATSAVRKWKFKPKVVDGEAVPSQGTQRVEFRLDRPRPNR